MKNLLLVCYALFFSLVGKAQIDKGNTLLGGSIGFGISSANLYDYSYNYGSNIQPNFQFAYAKNRTVGFGFDVTYNLQKSDESESRQELFAIAPSISFNQYHTLKGNLGWLLQESAGVGFSSQSNTTNGQTVKSGGTSVFGVVTPGLYYVVGEKKHWLLQASFGNVGLSYFDQADSDFSRLNFNFNLFQSYRLGFAYIF